MAGLAAHPGLDPPGGGDGEAVRVLPGDREHVPGGVTAVAGEVGVAADAVPRVHGVRGRGAALQGGERLEGPIRVQVPGGGRDLQSPVVHPHPEVLAVPLPHAVGGHGALRDGVGASALLPPAAG